MQCVILAGGLGTRMWPETRNVPKTLLPVGGRPFAGWQLEWLAAAGIDSVVYCIGHLGSQVVDFVGDGSAWGLDVSYVDEGDELRGTAGALRLALEQADLEDRFLVLYGDSWLQIDPGGVLRAAKAAGTPALMTVYRNDGLYDASNVIFDGILVTRYAKGLQTPPPQMRWIDYGLLALQRELVRDRVPTTGPQDLAPLCTELAQQRQLAGFLAVERFYEIGSPEGRAELERTLDERST